MSNASVNEEDLLKKAGKSGALLMLRKTWAGILNLAVMAYVARTLDTEDFGLAAIATTLVGIAQSLTSGGIGDFVIFYNKEDREEVQQAAFWLNVVLVLSICLVVLLLSPFWAYLYRDQRVSTLIWILLISFLSSVLNVVPQALLQKTMAFHRIVPIQITFGTLSQLSLVLFAWLGFGVYSLVLPAVIFTPLMGLSYFWMSGFRPALRTWGVHRWKEIFGYSKHVISSNFITKIANEGDTLLVGRLLGAEALGIYDIAFRLSNLFNQNLIPIITSISMPVFSRNQHDMPTLRRQYLKMAGLISFFSFPVMAGMAFFAQDMVSILYGEKWLPAVLPFQLFCVFSAVRSLGSPTSGLYNALGVPQIGSRFTLVFTPALFLAIYLSSFWGFLAVCMAVTAVRTIGTGLHFYIGNTLLHFGWEGFWKVVRGPLCASILSVAILLVLPWEPTLWEIPALALLFTGIMATLFSDDFKQYISQMSQLWPVNRLRPKQILP